MTNTTIANNLYPIANGTTSSNPFVDQFNTRNPTPQDVGYPIQKKWLNTVTGAFWELQSFNSFSGVTTATWILIGQSDVSAEKLTGNTGGPVPPTANNINVVGDGNNTTTVGNPGTSTIQINLLTPVGFFTPTIFGSTIAGTTTYSVQSGTYSRLGNLVYAQLSIAWTATTGTGDLTMTGFPYTFGGASPRAPICTVWIDDMTWPSGVTYLVGYGADATKNMTFPGIQSGAPSQNLQMQSTGTIDISIIYFTGDPF